MKSTDTEDTSAKRDYRATLNITLSDKDAGAFPQRGQLPTREPQFQARWEAMGLYRKTLDRDAPRGTFILHDGPPYSNGNIHIGHSLNKIAKDVVTRFRTMQGFKAPYVPGWDNHGMPIENAVAKKFREKKQTPDRVELRQACRKYAAGWVDIQREQFKRLGIRGDWDNPYLTMNSDFEADIVKVFGELAQGGFIYRGLRPVLWCAECETALADAEVEYESHTSTSIYVRFPLQEDPNGIFADASPDASNRYVIIWTTTPWTIPANLAVAVHPEAEYSVVRAAQGETTAYYLLAVPLIESVMGILGADSWERVRTASGKDLAGLVFKHPLFDRASPLVTADYVTMDTGTGVVHTAPGHGKEDFETGQKFGLEVLCPVNESGRYTAAAGEYNGRAFEGLRVTTHGDKPGKESPANGVLLEALQSSGNLLFSQRFDHSYPHCWRCHSPLIFRATVQWFMNIDHDGFRQKALAAIEPVAWYPKESINRITSMVSGRPDWCVSRQRSWGVGIPAFYCTDCGEAILTPESVSAVADLVRRESSDAWYARTAGEILPAGFACPKCGAGVDKLRKETDVLDVWFDSGSTNRAVLESDRWPDLSWPADMYLEGGDQHRGWFNSSLMISVATKGKAPYRSVVTNGWTLDEQGRAMHKSLGNVVNPLTVIDQFGADVLRWWVASTDFKEDVSCGDHVIKQAGETYRRIRNTFRFLVNNLYDFDPSADSVPVEQMAEIDRWILEKLNSIVSDSAGAYEAYEFHKIYHAVHNFCAVELSSFYLDVLKDRLYASPKASSERRSAQTALFRMAETLARLLAPILVHTCEEVWDHLKWADKPESVHLARLPECVPADEALLARWQPLLALRESVKKALEEARQSGTIGNPLEARVDLTVTDAARAALTPFEDQLPSLLLVSQAVLTVGAEAAIAVSRADGIKCARCWLVKSDVGADSSAPDLCVRCAEALAG